MQRSLGSAAVARHNVTRSEREVTGDARSQGSRIRALAAGASRVLVWPATAPLIGCVLIYLFFMVFSEVPFYSAAATASWLNVSAPIGVMAVAVGFLLIAGEFDLSIGSVVGTSTMVIGILAEHFGLPIPLAILCALAVSAAIGLLNGYLVTATRLQSFIVTLATMLALEGLSLGLSTVVLGTTSVTVDAAGAMRVLFGSSFDNITVGVLWWGGVVLVGWYALATTRFGNWTYAIGGSAEKARRAGVPVRRAKMYLFVLSSLAAGFVGVLLTVQYQSANVVTGQGYVFDVPVAAVIGGVLLSGGYGSVLGITFGAVLYGIVSEGVFYTGWDSDWSQFILGALLLGTVISNNVIRERAMLFAHGHVRLSLRRTSDEVGHGG